MAFKPYQPPTAPPPGYYDPALDSQERAAQRGFVDLQQDTDTAQARDRTALITNAGRGSEDYGTSTGRMNEDFQTSLAGLLRNRARGTQDYQTGNQDRTRNYQQLGNRQTQTAVNQGVTGGGALAAAVAARSENQGREQTAADTQYGRFQEDSSSQESGLRTSLQRGLADALTAFNRGREDLGQGYGYNTDDRATTLGRSGRELGFYQQDVGAQRFFQAGQSGWAPPGRGEPGGAPSNEFRDKTGTAYRVIMRGGQKVYVDQYGRPYTPKR
jgi:hypothetical protein